VHFRRFVEMLCPLIVLVAITGCCCAPADRLQLPSIATPATSGCWYDWMIGSDRSGQCSIDDFEVASFQAFIEPTAPSSAALSERAYALAERLHTDGDQRAVDYWARTIAWVDEARRRSGDSSCRCNVGRLEQLRDSATIRILSCGQSYGRLDPSSQLLIHGSGSTLRIPVTHQGFAWQPTDFHRLLVFQPPAGTMGNVCGQGVPLIVLTADTSSRPSTGSSCDGSYAADCAATGTDSFLDPRIPFAATALIQLPLTLLQEPADSDDDPSRETEGASVVLVNPLTIDPVAGCDRIAQSPAMPLLYARQASEFNPLVAFVNGDNGIDRPELIFLEPYQADKIPLIVVHGLISNPATFLEMADAVRADPWLRSRYQIWVFRYPTGDNFLESAAVLREQLVRAFASHDQRALGNETTDGNPRTQPAVIVGHSMGGLLSKLQVIDSEDQLWRSIANVPLHQLQGSPDVIANLEKSFFFQANPHIGRVVYIATPHQGSPWASRGIGRVAAALAGNRQRDERDYLEITRHNPTAFSGDFSDSSPSSVDLLRPNSQLLQSLASITPAPDVIVNSIIGEHCRLPRAGPSDGVVPVTSAFRLEAETTTIVGATHTSILKSREAQQALLEILRSHLESPAMVPIES
jgi:hypothetical protein